MKYGCQDDIKLTVNGTYDEFKIFRKGQNIKIFKSWNQNST